MTMRIGLIWPAHSINKLRKRERIRTPHYQCLLLFLPQAFQALHSPHNFLSESAKHRANSESIKTGKEEREGTWNFCIASDSGCYPIVDEVVITEPIDSSCSLEE